MCLGVPGEIIAIEDTSSLTAVVEISGVRRSVNLACVLAEGVPPESLLGQWVLVHVGFAMSLIDAEEARKTLELLAELQNLAEPGDPEVRD
jgi:hydrogenase expression/formation protein HypC